MKNSAEQIIFKTLDDRLSDHPWHKATAGSAGYDLRACVHELIVLQPNQVTLIPAGVSIKMPHANMAAIILPRSGMGHKLGLILGNGTGLIDSDYTGQLMISAWNRSTSPIPIQPMERIAQLVFVPVFQTIMVEGDVDADSIRGVNGFGHSGTK